MQAFLEKTLSTGRLPPSAGGHLDLDMKRLGSSAPHQREWALLAGASSDIRSLSMTDVNCSSLQGFPHLEHLIKVGTYDCIDREPAS